MPRRLLSGLPSDFMSPETSTLLLGEKSGLLPHPAADLHAVRRVARRLMCCDHLAEDAVQEALLALWNEVPRPENVRAWLIRAVMFRCQHLRRSLHRRRHHEHVATQDCELHKGCDNPLHVAMAHEIGEKLRQVLDTLPSPQREAFELYERTGLDYAGIAEKLGLPIGTIRSRLSRARAAITAALR